MRHTPEGSMASKKKGRNNRRNTPSASASAVNQAPDCPYRNETPTQTSCSVIDLPKPQEVIDFNPNEQGLFRESNVRSNLLPPMHINDLVKPVDLVNIEMHGGGVDLLGTSQVAEKMGFIPHWSVEDAEKAILERTNVFKAIFRVNAHDRFEAYCKIDGVPTDVFISGASAQNRAVEGDIVAVQVEPFMSWTEMKGLKGAHNNTGIRESCNHVEDKVGGSIGRLDNKVIKGVEGICFLIDLHPFKRPTGTVVSIIKQSPRRERIVGHLDAKKLASFKDPSSIDANKNKYSVSKHEIVPLIPIDPRFPDINLIIKELPGIIIRRLKTGDLTVEMDLCAVKIDDWPEESPLPQGKFLQNFGRGGEVQPQIDAILFQNSVCTSEFSPETLSCLPCVPWELPEIHCRADLRDLCIFTIDPLTATDLDDALSVEKLPNGNFRVGVHIADASYFVVPGTDLDKEARSRSTSVYMLQRKLPMLPALISQNIGSLDPGVDRLAVSMLLDINLAGVVVDRWIGRTVIQSCCKLSYEHVQDIIDKAFGLGSNCYEDDYPEVHNCFRLPDIITSLKSLYKISNVLKHKRFSEGALRLDNPKIVILFNEDGIPYDTMFSEQKESNCLVEEFMLLANTTAAEVICRAYPDLALLRRHPEPSMRKLKELMAFCQKHGLDLNTSSSGKFHWSLEQLKEKLKGDPVLYDIVISYATRPMQLASYFCSGDIRDNEHDCGHYALAVPLYTHFTSPLRRYPDILVHRTMLAVIEAEEKYTMYQNTVNNRCFTGIRFDKKAAESVEGREALSAAALKHGVPGAKELADIAAYCNERKLASRNVKDAIDRLYIWLLLKTKKVLSEARILGLGPKFMSIYIEKLATERRIYYGDVEGLIVEWLEATSSVVLSLSTSKRPFRRVNSNKLRALEEVVLLSCPYDPSFAMDNSNLSDGVDVDAITSAMDRQHISKDDTSETESGEIDVDATVSALGSEQISMSDTSKTEIEPGVFPLTVHLLSTIPIVLHAVGGDDGPVDFGTRLYMRSYFGTR